MQVVFLLYENLTALDLVGPHEILSRLPGAKTLRVAQKVGPVMSDSGLVLYADHDLSVDHADLLVIPGGGSATTLRHQPETLEWIRKIHATTMWTASVCTGSLILGAAGILQGVKATTHWSAHERLERWGAIPVQERVVQDGKLITAAGVAAGIDMALRLSELIAGEEFAHKIQLCIEYDPDPPFDVGSPHKANPELLERARKGLVGSFERG